VDAGAIPIGGEVRSSRLQVVPLGGCRGVNGSALLLGVGDSWIMMDAGLGGIPPLMDTLEHHPPLAVFVTHAHFDHVGLLPIIHRTLPDTPIYMTKASLELARLVLEDAWRLGGRAWWGMRKELVVEPGEVEAALEATYTVDFFDPVTVNGVSVELRPAGHVPGAASIMVEDSRRILYTGDINPRPQVTAGAAHLPDPPEPVDLLITEATLGDIDLPTRKQAASQLYELVNDAISRGGRLLVPASSFGAAHELVVMLTEGMAQGAAIGAPIYLDGLIREAAECYKRLAGGLPLEYREAYLASWRSRWVIHIKGPKERRRIAAASDRPCIIVASSGMLTGGPSVLYAEHIMQEDNSAILFLGAEEAQSQLLRHWEPGAIVTLPSLDSGQLQLVLKCRVAWCPISSHGDRRDLLQVARAYPPRAAILVHGTYAAKLALAGALRDQLGIFTLIPRDGQAVNVGLLTAVERARRAEIAGSWIGKRGPYERIVDDAYDLGPLLTAENLTLLMAKHGLPLPRIHPSRLIRPLFALSFKYAATPRGLDFSFPATLLRLLLQIMEVSTTPRKAWRVIARFGNWDRMFKNFILHGGNRDIRDRYPLYVHTYRELLEGLKDFQEHFAEFGFQAPTPSQVINVVMQEMAERKRPRAQEHARRFLTSLPGLGGGDGEPPPGSQLEVKQEEEKEETPLTPPTGSTYESIVDDIHNSPEPSPNLLRRLLQKRNLSLLLSSPLTAVPLTFNLFLWSLKYACREQPKQDEQDKEQKLEGEDEDGSEEEGEEEPEPCPPSFTFPALVLRLSLELLEEMHGEEEAKKLRTNVQEYAVTLFRDIVLRNGPRPIRRTRPLGIRSSRELWEALRSFSRSLQPLGIDPPSLKQIDRACNEEEPHHPRPSCSDRGANRSSASYVAGGAAKDSNCEAEALRLCRVASASREYSTSC